MFWRDTSTYSALLPELARLMGDLPDGLVRATEA